MATKLFLQGEVATAVYDDKWRSIYSAIGVLKVARATNVEFNNESGNWEATHLDSGELIATGTQRSQVIQQEVEWLEQHWLKTNHNNPKDDD